MDTGVHSHFFGAHLQKMFQLLLILSRFLDYTECNLLAFVNTPYTSMCNSNKGDKISFPCQLRLSIQIQQYQIFTFNRGFHVVLELSSKVNKRGYDSINMKQRQYIKKCTSYNAPIVHLIHLFSTFFGNNSSIIHITLVTKDHLFNIFICMLKLPRKFYFSYQSVRRSNQSES